MSGFDALHPAVQYHIVNSLGWKTLRPFQDEVIPQILSGRHMIVLAPTAGGKTEAAFFPAVSRILSENWADLSVLYVCPLKALLNNLNVRLQHYSRLLGLTTEVWHGDVGQSDRRRILQTPPNCLLTTPESLEVMLLSGRVDHQQLLGQVRMIIVDEIHSFAGDDRGWHLLSVLSRITRLAGREIQRVGLSATVGNPDILQQWLAGNCTGERGLYQPADPSGGTAHVTLDYTKSLENSATVISRLHRGQKRLTFVDSRSRVEQLSTALKARGTRTFLTHSSLSQEQRRAAERAFAEDSDCVIVATSVLELGIDVGDLDRVIQVDSPGSVAGFLQRMGRTGRRSNTQRNCLFLATEVDTMLICAAIIELWRIGYVEPVQPPAQPLHILAQQIMALALQERGVTRDTLAGWLKHGGVSPTTWPEETHQLLEWMQDQELLWEDQGLYWFGRRGEAEYGRRNFMELFSVFLTPPVFEIMHGRHHIGSVDDIAFTQQQQGPQTLLLGGTVWQVNHIEWSRKVAYVEPTKDSGVARWAGGGRAISGRVAGMVRQILCDTSQPDYLSNRAWDLLQVLREAHAGMQPDQTTLLLDPRSGYWTWLTHAGTRANKTLAAALRRVLHVPVKDDPFRIDIHSPSSVQEILEAFDAIRSLPAEELLPEVNEEALQGLKFSDCLPPELGIRMLQARMSDPAGVQQCLQKEIQVMTPNAGQSPGDDLN